MAKKLIQLCKYGPKFKGGMESEANNILKVMLKNDFNVKMIYFSSDLDRPSDKNKGACEEVVCSTVFTLFSQPFSLRYFLEVLKVKSDDIVHLHLPNYLALIASCFLSRKTKIIVHWHSDVINRPILTFFLYPLKKYILRRATKIICTSKEYAGFSNDLKSYSYKCKILPIATEQKQYIDKKILLNTTNIKLLNVGRLVNYKNQKFLLDVISVLPDNFTLEIVGKGYLKDFLEKKLLKMGLSNRVKISSNLSNVELSKRYRSADVFVFSSNSRAEAFGVVLVESLSYRLPLVTLRIEGSGVNVVNKHRFSGLQSEIGDIAAMAENILSITRNQTQYAKFSNNAYLHFDRNFTKKLYEQNLLNIYKDF